MRKMYSVIFILVLLGNIYPPTWASSLPPRVYDDQCPIGVKLMTVARYVAPGTNEAYKAVEDARQEAGLGNPTLLDDIRALKSTPSGTVHAENARLQRDVSIMTTEISTLRSSIGTITAERDSLRTENARLQADVRRLQAENATQQRDLADTQRDLTAARRQIAENERRIRELEGQRRDLLARLDQLKQRIDPTAATVEDAISNVGRQLLGAAYNTADNLVAQFAAIRLAVDPSDGTGDIAGALRDIRSTALAQPDETLQAAIIRVKTGRQAGKEQVLDAVADPYGTIDRIGRLILVDRYYGTGKTNPLAVGNVQEIINAVNYLSAHKTDIEAARILGKMSFEVGVSVDNLSPLMGALKPGALVREQGRSINITGHVDNIFADLQASRIVTDADHPTPTEITMAGFEAVRRFMNEEYSNHRIVTADNLARWVRTTFKL